MFTLSGLGERSAGSSYSRRRPLIVSDEGAVGWLFGGPLPLLAVNRNVSVRAILFILRFHRFIFTDGVGGPKGVSASLHC